jgi:phosphate starvation-inducible membrane PsiE
VIHFVYAQKVKKGERKMFSFFLFFVLFNVILKFVTISFHFPMIVYKVCVRY